jgi:hypothetical protein
MNYKVQLLSFFLSFLFGLFFSFTSRFHYKLVFSLNRWYRYFLTFLFILDISLLYILILYYVNQGVFHFYFLICTFIGYFCEKSLFKNVKKHVKFRRFVEKRFFR